MNQWWVYMCSPSWTPLPHPSPSHPSGSSQCTSPEYPVSRIEPSTLVICFTYDNIHISVLFSQIIAIFSCSTLTSLMAQVVKICLNAGDMDLIPGLILWRREWQSTPLFLPGESHGQRSLASYSPCGCKELDMAEWLTISFSQFSHHVICQYRWLTSWNQYGRISTTSDMHMMPS